MNLLAIDPGPTESAYVIWNGADILEAHKYPNESVLRVVDACARDASCDLLAIEMMACYGMAVGAEVFETCVYIGRFMERWIDLRNEATITRIPRLQVKNHICHSSRANDSNIRQALIDRLGKPGTKRQPGKTFGISGDVWAALGVAITVFDQSTAIERTA